MNLFPPELGKTKLEPRSGTGRELLTGDEARRIAANVAKLVGHHLELLCHSCVNARENYNETH
jgi:hypothetical protein